MVKPTVTVRKVTSKSRALGTLKLLAIAGVLFVTNDGIGAHMQLLIDQDRLSTLVMFAAVWLLCLGCLLIAAFQPRWPVRALWAFLFSLSSGAAYGYQLASGTPPRPQPGSLQFGARFESIPSRARPRGTSCYSWMRAFAVITSISRRATRTRRTCPA